MQGLTRKLFDALRKQHEYAVTLAMETAARPFYEQARNTCDSLQLQSSWRC